MGWFSEEKTPKKFVRYKGKEPEVFDKFFGFAVIAAGIYLRSNGWSNEDIAKRAYGLTTWMMKFRQEGIEEE